MRATHALAFALGCLATLAIQMIAYSGRTASGIDAATEAAWDDLARTARDSLPTYRARLAHWRAVGDSIERAIAE